jgi:GR25 family glycosyltransferase involved in LPS biosynthesis
MLKISKGFYINLDYRTDRKELIEKELERVGWQNLVERYPAIDGNSKYGQSVKCEVFTPEWTSVASSALKSHRNIVQYAKDNNLENVLILEDDCLFYDRIYTQEFINFHHFKYWQPGFVVNSMDIINKSLEQIEQFPNWEILCLGCTILPLEDDAILNLASPNLVKLETMLSCHSYIINHTAYDKLLKKAELELSQEKFCAMMDVVWHVCTEKYSVYPHAVVQQHTGITDIGGVDGVGPIYWDHNYDRKTVNLF